MTGEDLSKAIEDLDGEAVESLLEEATGTIEPKRLLKAITEGVRLVGERFQKGEYFLPELVYCAEIATPAIEEATKLLSKEGGAIEKIGEKIVIGTVEGDIHDIGKNVVKAVLVANGFQVRDLGIDVPATRFLQEAEEYGAGVIGASALLTTTRPKQKEIVDLLGSKGKRGSFKVIIGGAAVSREYAEQIGVDSYAEDAFEAVAKVRELLRK